MVDLIESTTKNEQFSAILNYSSLVTYSYKTESNSQEGNTKVIHRKFLYFCTVSHVVNAYKFSGYSFISFIVTVHIREYSIQVK